MRIVLVGTGMGVVLLGLEAGVARTAPGALTPLVSLVPVALSFAVGGPVGAGVAVGLAVLGGAVVGGASAAAVLGVRHAMPGLVLGVSLVRRLPLPLTLMLVGATSLGGLVLLLWMYAPAETRPLTFLQQELEAQVADLERLPARLGPGAGAAWVGESTRLAVSMMRVAGPAVILVSLLVVALANYLVARVCLRGQGFRAFAEEAVPDHLVWGVVAGGAMLVSPHEPLVRAGLNTLLVLVPLYAIQGLAVVRHFFLRAHLPRPLQGVGFGLFALQPLLLVGVACLGLTDLWADFRKIRRAPRPA